jgi:hypothetical protein
VRAAAPRRRQPSPRAARAESGGRGRWDRRGLLAGSEEGPSARLMPGRGEAEARSRRASATRAVAAAVPSCPPSPQKLREVGRRSVDALLRPLRAPRLARSIPQIAIGAGRFKSAPVVHQAGACHLNSSIQGLYVCDEGGRGMAPEWTVRALRSAVSSTAGLWRCLRAVHPDFGSCVGVTGRAGEAAARTGRAPFAAPRRVVLGWVWIHSCSDACVGCGVYEGTRCKRGGTRRWRTAERALAQTANFPA